MKTKLFNLCTISLLSLFSFTSCNLPVNENKFYDFGFIYEYGSSTSYIIKTDTCDLVWDAMSRIPIEREWVGMRIKVSGNIITPAYGGVPAKVQIESLGKVPFVSINRKSEVDQLSIEKQDSIRGRTGLKHLRIGVVNNIMNFEYLTVSTAASQTGYSSLVFNDEESTDDLKIFNWYYTAKPNANIGVDAANSFDIEDVLGSSSRYTVRIYYKDLVTSNETHVDFTINNTIQ